MWLFDTLIGNYVIQTFLHSLISILIIERALVIWDIKNHLSRFRYRLMTVILPFALFPLFLIFSPERDSPQFRESMALFNMDAWLGFEILDTIPVTYFFLGLFIVTAIVFFAQEIIPILRDALASKGNSNSNKEGAGDSTIDDMIDALCLKSGAERPKVRIISEDTPVILTEGAFRHKIVISSGLLKMLDRNQLYSALAHEIAHIVRRSNATTWAIFLLRIFMFFNPIILIVFRRIVQDDEHVCDDITVSLTDKPLVLADTLKAFYSGTRQVNSSDRGRLSWMREEIESHSHNLLLTERIERLEGEGPQEEHTFKWDKFILTVCVIVVINYFVV